MFIDYNEFEGTPPLSTDELGLLVDAALAACLKTLQLNDSGLTPAAAPVLARLLSSPALTYLHIMNHEVYGTLLDAPGYALLGNALRSNRTLRELALANIVWYDAAAEVPALLMRSLDTPVFAALCAQRPIWEHLLRETTSNLWMVLSWKLPLQSLGTPLAG